MKKCVLIQWICLMPRRIWKDICKEWKSDFEDIED